jgi:hypothetical protein
VGSSAAEGNPAMGEPLMDAAAFCRRTCFFALPAGGVQCAALV